MSLYLAAGWLMATGYASHCLPICTRQPAPSIHACQMAGCWLLADMRYYELFARPAAAARDQ